MDNGKLKVLELFAGSRSFGKVCDKYRINIFSNDILGGSKIYKKDFLDLSYSEIPFIPDIIWASPPCTAFSIASNGHHFKSPGLIPKTNIAIDGLLLLKKTLLLIKYYKELNPHLEFYIENPRGLMRKSILMKDLEFYRKTITYCQYGFDIMKPTDIWTNNINFIARPMCTPGSNCHKASPRNSSNGLIGLSKKKRSLVPELLFEDILFYSSHKNKYCEKRY